MQVDNDRVEEGLGNCPPLCREVNASKTEEIIETDATRQYYACIYLCDNIMYLMYDNIIFLCYILYYMYMHIIPP